MRNRLLIPAKTLHYVQDALDLAAKYVRKMVADNVNTVVPPSRALEIIEGVAAELKRSIPNARFWIFWNGDLVKLTLRPGQAIEKREPGYDEEDWLRPKEHYRYDVEEGIVECRLVIDSGTIKDRVYICPLTDLAIQENSIDREILMPKWQ